eukprot:3614847-Pleurochrysis_carterae.AAC.1
MEEERENRESATALAAPAACARELCGDVRSAYLALTNVSVWSLPAPTSDRHALRHVADYAASPLEAICTEISISPPGALGRPAVLAHIQSSGY